MLSPKNQFLQSKERGKNHLALVKSDGFEEAIIYARAEVSSLNPTAEQMKGINFFIETFVHLAEPDDERASDFAAPRLIPPEMLGK